MEDPPPVPEPSSQTMHPFLAVAAGPSAYSYPQGPEGYQAPAVAPQPPGQATMYSPVSLGVGSGNANAFLMQALQQQQQQQQQTQQAQGGMAAAPGTALQQAPLMPQTLFPSYGVPNAYQPFPQAQLLQLQAQAAIAAARVTQQTSSGGKVKLLLTSGGASATSAGGVWEYVGGETRLLGGLDPFNNSYADLVERVEAEANVKLGLEGVLRYELPGCPGTLVNVRCCEDVANMWSEWNDFCNLSKQPTFKLHLYVDRMPSTRTHSSHNSGGSPSATTSGSLPSAVANLRTSLEGPRSEAEADGQHPEVARRESGAVGSPSNGVARRVSFITTAQLSPVAGPRSPQPQQDVQHSRGQGSAHATRAAQAAAALGVGSGDTSTPGTGSGSIGAAGGWHSTAVAGSGGKQSVMADGTAAAQTQGEPRAQDKAQDKAKDKMQQAFSQSLASFDRLLTRVRNSVEIIRPADLRIIRFIGSGGFADCYLAKWLGVEVAVKCLRDLPGVHASSRAAVKELLREASVLSGLRHPNVLCLYAVALPDKLSIEYGIGPAAAQEQQLPRSPPASQPCGSQRDGSQLPTVVEGAGDETEASSKASSEQERLNQAISVEKESAPGSPRAGMSDSAVVPGDATKAKLRFPDMKDNQVQWEAKVGSPQRPGAGSPDAMNKMAGARTAPTSPFAAVAKATTQDSPFARIVAAAHANTTARSGSADSMPAEAAGHPTQGSVGLQHIKPAESRSLDMHSQSSQDRAVSRGRLSCKASASAPSPGTPDQISPARPPADSLGGAGTASTLGSAAPSATSIVLPHAPSTAHASSVISYGVNCTGLSDVASSVGTIPPCASSETTPTQSFMQHILHSTDEDESICKAVKAAEAAAAASADAESQSAVSEGLITRPALVAEFLSGCSLGSAIRRKADFLNSDLVLTKVAMDAARGMEYCHAKRITHWNLKIGNLMVGFTSDKVPLCKVADIGLCRPRQLAELDDAGVARVLPWAAPELVRAPSTATEKVDVYSYGMVLWSMWARHHPFDNSDIARVFLRTMQGHAVRPPLPGTPEWDSVYPGEPSPKEPVPGWSALLQRCWDTDPAARPSFAEISGSMISMFGVAKAAKRAARAAANAAKAKGAALTTETPAEPRVAE